MLIEVKGKVFKSGQVKNGKLQGMNFCSLLVKGLDGQDDVFTVFTPKVYRYGQEVKLLVNVIVRSGIEVEAS